MGSYIDFQIKVTGPAISLIKLKELLIKVDNENKVMIKDFFILLGIATVVFASISFTFFGNFI